MDYSFYDFLMLVGSLALFLYGMKIMSEGLQKIAGEQLRNILSIMTRNRVMGVLTGVLVTALIQSSSATTVMVVSFVNAGLLSLAQAIGVILGANIGTTVTAWIISLFGFGKLSISALSIPLLGLGLPFVLSANSKRKSIGEFIYGFAFLFLGLDLLKSSMPDIQSNPEILAFVRDFSDKGFLTTLLFLGLGTILTVIVQSSSATVAITLIMCSNGWISFEPAAAMILGENIGTTITANLAALSANTSAKRAAFAHFLINVLGVVWMLFIFHYFVLMVENIIANSGPANPRDMDAFMAGISNEELKLIQNKPASELSAELAEKQKIFKSYEAATSYGLSLFHTLFNMINVCILIWFVKPIEKLSTKIIKRKTEDDDDDFKLQYISTGMMSTSELSILQAEKETELYGKRVKRMFGFVRKMSLSDIDNKRLKLYTRIEKYEGISDRMEVEIGSYLNKVAEGKLSSESKESIRKILRAVTEIESIADSSHNIARHLNRKNETNVEFPDNLKGNIASMFDLLEKALDNMQLVLNEREATIENYNTCINLENRINELRNMLKRKNIEDVNENVYSYQVGVFYMDIISECEKMGDYIINVVEALKRKVTK